MTDLVLSFEQLALALAAIDTRPAKGWWQRQRLVLIVGRVPTGQLIARDTLTRQIGAKSHKHVSDLLAGLVRDRVLHQVVAPAGRRPAGYRVNPELLEWRGVPWLRDPRAVISDMFHEEPLPGDEFGASRLVYAPGDNAGLVARYMHQATSRDVAARSMHQATSRDPVARSMHRATTASAVARSMHQATTEEGDQVGSPSWGVDPLSSSSSGGGSEDGGAAPGAESQEHRGAVGALVRRLGGGWCKGRPRALLGELVDTYGLQVVVAAISELPSGISVPAAVDRVADALAVDALGVDVDAGPAETPPTPPRAPQGAQERTGPALPPIWAPEPDAEPVASAETAREAARRAREALGRAPAGQGGSALDRLALSGEVEQVECPACENPYAYRNGYGSITCQACDTITRADGTSEPDPTAQVGA